MTPRSPVPRRKRDNRWLCPAVDRRAGILGGIALMVAFALGLGDIASATIAPSTSVRPTGRKAAALHAPAASDAITFDEYGSGTTVTTQYADRGVVFTSNVYVTGDGSNPTSPVLSGVPLFQGPIRGRFVIPGTTTPTTVFGFSLDVGYIDSRNSVEVTYYDAAGATIGSMKAQSLGIDRITVRAKDIASFSVHTVSDEPAGFAIDNLEVLRAPAGITPTRIASLGDSYSSGEGLLPDDRLRYDCGTDLGDHLYYENTTVPYGFAWIPGNDCRTDSGSYERPSGYGRRSARKYHNRCHRGGWAFPNAIRTRLDVSADNAIFTACSGAKTAELRWTAQYPSSPYRVFGGQAQFNALADFAQAGHPDLITVGIGGNDAEFSEIIRTCMLNACLDEDDSPGFARQTINRVNGTMFANVRDTLRDLRQTYGATIAAFGYPNPIGDPAKGCAGVDLYFAKIEESERRWLKDTLLPTINDAVADAAAEAGVTYIDISDAFKGHEICTDDPWINGLRPGTGDDFGGLSPIAIESFHPNQHGHKAITDLFMRRYVASGQLVFSNPPESPPLRPAAGPEIRLATVKAGAYNGLQPTACVQACTLRIQAQGFSPNTNLRVTLHSDPIDLGTVASDGAGEVNFAQELPAGLAAGVHAIKFRGVDSEGQQQYGSTNIEVFATAPPVLRLPVDTDPESGIGIAPPITPPAPPVAPAPLPAPPNRPSASKRSPKNPAVAKVRFRKVTVRRGGTRIAVRLQCRAKVRCKGRLSVTSGQATIRRGYSVAARRTVTISLVTTRKMRSRLRRASPRLRFVAKVGATDAGHRTVKVRRLRGR